MYYFVKFILKRMQVKYGLFIEPNVFGMGLCINHIGGIVINPRCRIGNYCVIHQNVTIGNDGKIDKAPLIGDNCFIGANACIIGNIVLGSNVTVGAGAVVTKNFGSECTLVGVPAQKL